MKELTHEEKWTKGKIEALNMAVAFLAAEINGLNSRSAGFVCACLEDEAQAAKPEQGYTAIALRDLRDMIVTVTKER